MSGLELAVGKLWVNEPNKSIEKALKTYANDSNAGIACKSFYNLANLYLMKNDTAKTLICNNELSDRAETKQEKDLAEKLKSMLNKNISEREKEKANKLVNVDCRNMSLQNILNAV